MGLYSTSIYQTTVRFTRKRVRILFVEFSKLNNFHNESFSEKITFKQVMEKILILYHSGEKSRVSEQDISNVILCFREIIYTKFLLVANSFQVKVQLSWAIFSFITRVMTFDFQYLCGNIIYLLVYTSAYSSTSWIFFNFFFRLRLRLFSFVTYSIQPHLAFALFVRKLTAEALARKLCSFLKVGQNGRPRTEQLILEMRVCCA